MATQIKSFVKKFKAFLIMMLIAIGALVAGLAVRYYPSTGTGPTLWEAYNDNLESTTYTGIYGTHWTAQTFTLGFAAHSITSVKLKLYRVGTISSYTVTVEIRATSASKPTGSNLTTKATLAGNLVNTTAAWFEFSMTELNLNVNTMYSIVVSLSGGSSSAYLGWRSKTGSPYGLGATVTSTNSGSSWGTPSSSDSAFEVWGNAYTVPPSVAGIIGYDTKGGTADYYSIGGSGNPDYLLGSRFLTTSACTMYNITTYVYNTYTTTRTLWCAIYADSSGAVGTIIGSNSTTVVTSGNTWYTATFTAGIALNASSYYWLAGEVLGVHTTAGNGKYAYAYKDSGSTSQSFSLVNTGAAPPSPLTADAYSNYKLSIFANYTSAGPAPTYGASASTPSVNFAGQNVTLSTYWISPIPSLTNLSIVQVAWNTTGTEFNVSSYVFPANTAEGWANITLIDPLPGNQTIQWRMFCKTTAGAENVTGNFTYYEWRYDPQLNPVIFGAASGTSRSNICHNGSHLVDYLAYQNSSFDPWHMQIRAYDSNTSAWYGPVDVFTSNPATMLWSDPHCAPSVSITPEGYLMYFVGYGEECFFKMSTNTVNSTTDTLAIISSWSNVYPAIGEATDQIGYPTPFTFSDSLWLGLCRSGGQREWYYDIYYPSKTVEFECTSFDSNYTEWDTTGTSPYINGTGTIGLPELVGLVNKTEGWFTMAEKTTKGFVVVNYSSLVATLCIFLTSASWSTVSVIENSTGNSTIMTIPANTAGWTNATITQSLYNSSYNSGLKIKLNATSGYSGNLNISRIVLKVQFQGFYELTLFAGVYDYSKFAQSGDNLLMTTTGIDNVDVYFAYSPDKGVTWKNASGTTLTKPFNLAASWKVTSYPTYTMVLYPTIDENNRACFPFWWTNSYGYFVIPDGFLGSICYYSAALGSAGTWTVANITDASDGTQLRFSGAWVFYGMDSYNYRPFYYNTKNGIVNKYVRLPTSNTTFVSVWNYTAGEVCFGGSVGIQNIQANTYDILSSQGNLALGNMSTPTNWILNSGLTWWGSNFTALHDQITAMTFFGNTSGGGDAWIAGVYNSTFNLQGQTTGDVTTGTSGYGWLYTISFNPAVSVTVGNEYWIFMRCSNVNQTQIGYTITSEAGCASYYNTGVEAPSTIVPDQYYNRQMCLYGRINELVVYGVGAQFSDMLASTNHANTECDFTVTWQGIWNTLNYTNFMIVNGTGEWLNFTINAGELGYGGMTAYGNITLTLPDAGLNVTWREQTYDNYGYMGDTGNMTFLTITSTVLSHSPPWNSFTAVTVDVGHTLAQVNASLTYDSIGWSYIVMQNATAQYVFVKNRTYNAAVVVQTGNTLFVWCTDASATWYHTYP